MKWPAFVNRQLDSEQLGLVHFVRDYRAQASSFRKLSLLERRYWDIAERAPFGIRLIEDEKNGPYLLRVYLTPENRKKSLLLPRLYLHYFFRGDLDREVHNHPWRRARSLILTGGYTEYRWDRQLRRMSERLYLPGMVNRINRNDFHRVELVDPEAGCWTLFCSHGRVGPSDGKDWGFLNTTNGLFTPWGQYVMDKVTP
jgi:hypothetical protein